MTKNITFITIRDIKKQTNRTLEWANRWQYRCVCNKEWSRHPWGHSAPRQCKTWYRKQNHGTLAEIQVGGSRSPSIQSRHLSLRLRHFCSPKEGSEGQTIHLGRRRQAVGPMCGTGSQRSPGNFTRQPFTALYRSGTSTSTARANTSVLKFLYK